MQLRYFQDHSLSEHAAALYDAGQHGMVVIPEFLTGSGAQALLEEARSNASRFYRAKPKHGKVEQDFFTIYFGECEDHWHQRFFPHALAFRRTYQTLVDELASAAGFQHGSTINSIGINHYPHGSDGIGIHQDNRSDFNLVSVAVLAGRAPFYSCMDRAGTGLKEHVADARSLILMRHHRSETEVPLDVWHGIGPVREERYSLLLRQQVKKS